MKSLLVGTSDDTNYIYLPMPFDKSARIELVSERTAGPAIDVQGEIEFNDVGRSKDEGKLYSRWRRENLTVEGRPFNHETQGRETSSAHLQPRDRVVAFRLFEGKTAND